MNTENYQKLLSALTEVISPFDSTDDKTKTKLNINNRTINVPTVFRDIVVEGDANSKTITFTMNRYYDEIDLSDKKIIIKFINAKNYGDWFHCETITFDDDLIQFVWLIDERVTVGEGVVSYIIEFSGKRNSLPYYLHTNPSFFKVEKGLDIDDHIISKFPSVLQNHESRLLSLESHFGVDLSNVQTRLNDLEQFNMDGIGDIKTLKTDSKYIVGAINEIKELSQEKIDFSENPIDLSMDVIGKISTENIDTTSMWGEF